ncbi:MAG: glycosyltransferase family 2 protein [Caulobacterales bacterium]|nr:glycosyltransferase family 2 protein [Caulobacterales bacterium]
MHEPSAPEATTRPTLSVIVPCFNEEAVIAHAHERLTRVLASTGLDFEIVYVDDGSSDRTALLLRDIQAIDPRARVIRLSRNFGHQIAVTAGLDYAEGDAVIMIDADMQDPPELIPAMIAKWRDGFEVVYGVRTVRPGESLFKRWTAHAFYRLINSLSEVPLPLDSGDFRLIDRRAVLALRRMRERHRLLRAMTTWVGFRQAALPYARERRIAGASKYPLRKMIALALDGIISFSVVPLRLVTIVGLIMSALSVVGIFYALLSRLFTNDWVPGWTLLFISQLLIGGLQFIFLGIIGEYVGRIYTEAKERPLFLVLEVLGPDRFAERANEETRA